MSAPHIPITGLLRAWREGDQEAGEEVMGVVYGQLRLLAGRYFSGERPGHTLQPTALVHEACVKLMEAEVQWTDRVHFFALAAGIMRRILVDHARLRDRVKRGGEFEMRSLDEAMVFSDERSSLVIDLDEALSRLEAVDPRKSRIVEMLYFGGLSYEEIAGAVEVSTATVHRELKFAKAWLLAQLQPGGGG